jgi:glutaredoxin
MFPMIPTWSYIYIISIVLGLIIYYQISSKNITIYWFMKPECKFCIEMKPEWNKVENKLCASGIIYKTIDITDSKHKYLKDNFEFKTVPYIVKINNNGTREVFDGERKCDDIIGWIYKNYE